MFRDFPNRGSDDGPTAHDDSGHYPGYAIDSGTYATGNSGNPGNTGRSTGSGSSGSAVSSDDLTDTGGSFCRGRNAVGITGFDTFRRDNGRVQANRTRKNPREHH